MKIISYVIKNNGCFLRFDSQHCLIDWVIDPHKATKFKSTTIQYHFDNLKQLGLIVFPEETYQFIPYSEACHKTQ